MRRAKGSARGVWTFFYGSFMMIAAAKRCKFPPSYIRRIRSFAR